MKNLNKFLALSFLAIASAATASAQSTDTESQSASVQIASPITLTAGTAMDFGIIVASAAGGTATLNTAGVVAVSGVTNHPTSSPAAASFNVTGEGTSSYAITLPTSISLAGPVGSTAMTVNAFSVNSATRSLVGGADSFSVGATLNVGASQASGSYTGTFNVTVAYN